MSVPSLQPQSVSWYHGNKRTLEIAPKSLFFNTTLVEPSLHLVHRPSVIHWLRLTKCAHASTLMDSKPSRTMYMLYIHKWSNPNVLSCSSLSFLLLFIEGNWAFQRQYSTGRAENHSPYHHGNTVRYWRHPCWSEDTIPVRMCWSLLNNMLIRCVFFGSFIHFRFAFWQLLQRACLCKKKSYSVTILLFYCPFRDFNFCSVLVCAITQLAEYRKFRRLCVWVSSRLGRHQIFSLCGVLMNEGKKWQQKR